MFGRHPKTGAPIRILTSDTALWKDAKTLVWLNGTEPDAAWNRWDVGVVGLEALHRVHGRGWTVDYACFLEPAPGVVDWVRAGGAATVQVFVASRAVLEAIGLEELFELHIKNMICLEDAICLYPFLGSAWDGTALHAQHMITHIFRYGVTLPVEARTATSVAYPYKVEPTLRQPAPLWFLTQYYRPEKAKRARELDLCLQRNCANPLIDRIVLLNEREFKLPAGTEGRVEQHSVGGRLRFSTVLRWIAEHVPAEATVVFANSDIYLDETARELWSVNLQDTFMALLRWDDQEDGSPATLFGPRPDSQDTWIVSAASVKSRTWNWASLDFPFGQAGCDNAITVELLRQKFLIANPALSIKTHHVHWSGVRSYDPADIVNRTVYMYVNPTGLHDMKPVTALPGPPATTFEATAWSPQPTGPTLSEAQRKTVETMLWRRANEGQTTTVAGPMIPARSIPIHEVSNVFQTYDGLTYTYDSILMLGGSSVTKDAWAATELSTVTETLDIDTALIAYCPDEVANNPVRYALQYLGKAFAMREAFKVPLAEFLGTDTKASKDLLQLFRWPNSVVTVVSRTKPFQAWCRKAYVWPAAEERQRYPTRHEIAALRGALQSGWTETAATSPRRIVCVADPVWSTEALKVALPAELEVVFVSTETPMVKWRKALDGATGAVVLGGAQSLDRWGLLWMLPADAWVLEVQSEMDVSMELMQLCSIAGLRHALHSVPRSRPGSDRERQDFHAAVGRAVRSLCGLGVPTPTVVPPSPSLPVLSLPSSATKGFFGHAGDSFRETARMWAERGYVQLEEVRGQSQVWLGGMGATLLYDRPTLEWLKIAPKDEQTFRVGLFGNPEPPEGGQAWSFWPRRPRLVEALAAAGAPTAGWEERARRLVFYGRSENAVQKARRTAADWGSAFRKEAGDEWVYLEGASTPYPFGQQEYLERLASARFGLCLAGYGKKCHREIECMAMGCVPVVAPDVDMTSYSEPPIEGVHYLRVRTPEEVGAVLAAISPERWAQMSAAGRDWWSRNASVDGMWRLTKRLAQV